MAAIVGVILGLSLLRLTASSMSPPSGAGTVSPTTTGLTWPSGEEAVPPASPGVVPDATPVRTATPGDPPTSSPPPPSSASAMQCRKGANGGATEKGVTADRISLLGAAQLDGPAKSLVEDVPLAWKAVIDAVNDGGGICGRKVTVTVVSRPFAKPAAALGDDGYVGMLLGPLDPDIGDRLRDGNLDRWRTPIVGGDGARAQFSSSWLWPVDLPTGAFARIGVDEAYRTGARTFAVVHDRNAGFDDDAVDAVRTYLSTLEGARLRATAALDPNAPSYSSTASELRAACGQAGCEAVVLALFPETAKKWLQAGGPIGAKRTAAPASLLSEGFGRDCVRETSKCDTIRLWTGFTPPLPAYSGNPDMARYNDDLGTRSYRDPWTTSAYVAAQVMVAALQRAGPRLDRESLRAALDALEYQSGLVSQLDWGPTIPSGRVGNTSARATMAKTSAGAFIEFVDAGAGWVRDPWPGRFPD